MINMCKDLLLAFGAIWIHELLTVHCWFLFALFVIAPAYIGFPANVIVKECNIQLFGCPIETFVTLLLGIVVNFLM